MTTDKVFTKQRGGTFGKRCKHFAGIDFTDPTKQCEAGVLMKDVTVIQPFKYRYGGGGTVYTSGYSQPCFSDSDPFGVCECKHQRFPTAEEVAAEEAKMDKLLNRTFVARDAIVKATGGKRGVSGKIACPVCNTGELAYSVAGINGHIWAKCSTEDCVSWME